MEGKEVLHPALAKDAQKLCSLWGADKKGGVGPFKLWVLVSAKLEEKTAVFFRVFKVAGMSDMKPVVLMCTDTTRYMLTWTNDIDLMALIYPSSLATNVLVFVASHRYRSSLSPNLYRPTFAGFVETDFSQGKITLRSLVCRRVPYYSSLLYCTTCSSQLSSKAGP
jgi:beta-fructofuranosidase